MKGENDAIIMSIKKRDNNRSLLSRISLVLCALIIYLFHKGDSLVPISMCFKNTHIRRNHIHV